MSILNEKMVLGDGNKIPSIGMGFWQVSPEDAKRVVLEGLELGYRHIDTAVAYSNETEIGKALKETELSREELFITSKVPAEIKSYNEAKKAIDDSLTRLGLSYLDLMLIHAPKPWTVMHMHLPIRYDKGNVEVYRALMEAQKEGKIKSIGVSNFKVRDLKNIIDNLGAVPAANQIRTHIGHIDNETIEFCKENKILVEGYSPIMTGRLKNNGKVNKIAEKLGVTVPQLCIKFVYDLGVLPLPKTTHREFLAANLKADFDIPDEDKKELLSIKTF